MYILGYTQMKICWGKVLMSICILYVSHCLSISSTIVFWYCSDVLFLQRIITHTPVFYLILLNRNHKWQGKENKKNVELSDYQFV